MPLPCEVRDAVVANVAFLADAAGLAALLPHPGLEVVGPLQGRGVLMLSAAHYRDNDLGPYDELSIAAVVRLVGDERPRPSLRALIGAFREDVGTCILRLPVDEEFSCAAGREVWGFPKTVEDLTVGTGDGMTVVVWRSDGRDVLRLAVRSGGRLNLPVAEQVTYTVLDGQLQRVRYVIEPGGVRLGPGGAKLHLGSGPVADELRSLSLSRPLFTVSMDRMRGRFEAPVAVGP